MQLFDIDGGGVAWWRRQPVQRFDWIAFYIGVWINEFAYNPETITAELKHFAEMEI